MQVELYTTWGKIWTCGGVGQCGTCIVEVVEGAELLSEKNAIESKKLNRVSRLQLLTFMTHENAVVIASRGIATSIMYV